MAMSLSAYESNPESTMPYRSQKEAEEYLGVGFEQNMIEQGAEYGKALGTRMVGFIGETAKGVVRPVMMPLQTIGRAGNTASMNAIAKSLPGVVRKAVPQLKFEIDQMLRKLHKQGDASELLPEDLRDKLALRIELADAFAKEPEKLWDPTNGMIRGKQANAAHVEAESSIFEEFALNLKNVAKAVQVGSIKSAKVIDEDPNAAEKAQEAAAAAAAAAAGDSRLKRKAKASSTNAPSSATAPPSALGADGAPAEPSKRDKNVTKIAFMADAAVSLVFKERPSTGGSSLRITVCLKNGMPLGSVEPNTLRFDTKLRIWWDTSSGVLKVSFKERPTIDYGAQLHLLGKCALPRGCTDWLTATIVSHVLGGFDDNNPIAVPLAVPVAMQVTDFAADEEDSLAALPGLVREATRVLNGLTNPLVVDNIVPRAAFRLARGVVIMTHVRGGMAMWGGGMGSGILLRKLPTGRWSGPASLGTLTASLGLQVGWRKTDTLLILPTDYHVDIFQAALDGVGQIKVGATIAVAAGPVGRDAAVDARIGQGGAAVCLSYSHSQGVYAGWNLEGEVIVGRRTDNEEYYYTEGVTTEEILDGVVSPPNDKEALALYEILDDLSSGTEEDVAANVVSDTTAAAARGVAAGASLGGKVASDAANSAGYAISQAGTYMATLGGSPIELVGKPARVADLVHAWEGTYQIENAFLPGMPSRLLRISFSRSADGPDALLMWSLDAKHGAFFQPAGKLAAGMCVVHAGLKALGEERLVFDSQFGRHVIAWRDDGANILEQVCALPPKHPTPSLAPLPPPPCLTTRHYAPSMQNDTARGETPEQVEGGCLWAREEEADVSESRVAIASELKQPWLGTWERRDDSLTGRNMQLKLAKRGDGSGIVGWKMAATNSALLMLAPAGHITGGTCNRIEITPRLRKPTAVADKKLFEAVKSPAVEERLLFESRWGSHTLKLTAGGKQLIEENTNGGARTILTWTLVEPAEGAAAAKPELKLW